MALRRNDRSRRRLGRGLDSLMSTPVQIETKPQPASDQRSSPATAEAVLRTGQVQPPGSARKETGGIQMIPTDEIHPNPNQPRKHFDEASLRSLAASIRSAGLMQPIVVRPGLAGGFQLVVGERRWRAAQLIRLSPLPTIVRELDDQTATTWALIENVQREDLNPIERAEAFCQLIDEHGLTHQELADRVGVNRSSVTNFLRLLELDEASRAAVRGERLTVGHAKALLAITNLVQRRRLAEAAIRQAWSVRELERRVGQLSNRTAAGRAGQHSAVDPHLQDLQRQLGAHLGTKVTIQEGKKKGTGRLIIDFYGLDQFDGLMQRLGFVSE
ncbi:MAG: ParB/RepB/Spo0J family partition protein [Phycisphaerales bacterium]